MINAYKAPITPQDAATIVDYLAQPRCRQPRDGAAGIALDSYRSKVRLVQAWAGGEHCYVFDTPAA